MVFDADAASGVAHGAPTSASCHDEDKDLPQISRPVAAASRWLGQPRCICKHPGAATSPSPNPGCLRLLSV
jgi:hypothetical protein